MSEPEYRKIAGKYHDLTDKLVHHIDGDRSNNHPGNLVVMDRKEHYHIHGTMGGWKGNNSKKPRLSIKTLDDLLIIYNNGF